MGEMIKKARGKQSLREFADKCDISHSYLDDIEKGYDHNTKKEISVTIETLQKLSKGTGYSINEILGVPYNLDLIPEDQPIDELPEKIKALQLLDEVLIEATEDEIIQIKKFAAFLKQQRTQ